MKKKTAANSNSHFISLSSIARRAEEDHLSSLQRTSSFTLLELLITIAIIGSYLLKKLTASRFYGDLSRIWFAAEKKKVNRYLIPEIFTALQNLTPQDIADFAEKELASRQYDLFVVGPVDKLDRKKLEKYGEVVQVTPEQIFGY